MSDYKRNPRSARRARKSLSRKALVVLSLMMVLAVAAVGGTVAWLTATTTAVTNTFTVGDITISLAETTGTNYKIVPGATDSKDPTVTVSEGSEKCFVYVTVENNLLIDGTTVATVDIDSTKWTAIGTTGTKTLYKYYQVVDAMDDAAELPVFTTVSYSGSDITKENISQLNNKTIVINAYAHQSENTNEAAADNAAKIWAGIPTTTP